MKKSVCFAVLMTLLGTNNLFAGQHSDGIPFRGDWGLDKEAFQNIWACKMCATDVGLPGGNNGNPLGFSWNLRDYDNYGVIYYVAHEMHEGGALFCKTIIGADRGNCHGKPYTTYYKSGDNCFWLCKSGYHGAGCAKVNTGNADTCQSFERFTAHTFTNKLSNYTRGTDVDKQIPMFFQGVYKVCGGSIECFNSAHSQEHDVVLAIKDIIKETTDGNKLTFNVQPLVVRAAGVRGCYNRGQYHGWPLTDWVGTQNNLCPEGWILGSDGKCTVDSASDVCKLSNLCGGFPKEKYIPTEHTLQKSEMAACFEYRCNKGTAFKAKDDLTCTPCAPTDAEIPELYYVPKDGLCYSCNKGQWPVFTYMKDSNGKDTSIVDVVECKEATPFTHNELQYGQKTVPDTVEPTQCWTKTNPDDFFGCVTGKCSNGKTWEKDGDCEGGILFKKVDLSSIQVATKNTLNTTLNNMSVEQK